MSWPISDRKTTPAWWHGLCFAFSPLRMNLSLGTFENSEGSPWVWIEQCGTVRIAHCLTQLVLTKLLTRLNHDIHMAYHGLPPWKKKKKKTLQTEIKTVYRKVWLIDLIPQKEGLNQGMWPLSSSILKRVSVPSQVQETSPTCKHCNYKWSCADHSGDVWIKPRGHSALLPNLQCGHQTASVCNCSSPALDKGGTHLT
jgi:hypothetical protein